MNFDTLLDRQGTGCIKWDRRPGLDPYWVADMDFTSCPAIIEALHKRVDHGIYGYPQAHAGLNEALLDYLSTRHGSQVSIDQILHLGGLVPALSLAARAFCQPGDELMTCTPVYYPFLNVGKDAQVDTIAIPHVELNERWTFDFPAMEAAVTPKTRIFFLCSPQNPLGRSFTPEEIIELAEFCQRHDLVLLSDEIHCDLVFNEDQQPFYSALRLPEHLRQKLIVLQSPSKTYNIAGLGYAFAVIEDDATRHTFNAAKGHTLPEINCLAFYAAEAAYRHGEPWRQELLSYLRMNRDTLCDFIKNELPTLHVSRNEATYLALIDCRSLGLSNPAHYLEKHAGLFISDGAAFGAPGHIRFNFGCPNSRVLSGLEKIKTAFTPQLLASC